MNILFITSMLPASLRGGGPIVTENFVAALRELGAAVTLLGYQTDSSTARPGEISVGARTAETTRAPFRAALWGAAALARHNPYSLQKWMGGAYRSVLRQLLSLHSWDVIIIEHAQMAWVIKYLGNQPFIFLSHNAEALLYAELARERLRLGRMVYQRESRLMHQVEKKLAREAAEVWTLTGYDADYFNAIGASQTRVFQVPSRKLIQNVNSIPRECVALLGTWTWQPNRAGLDWYIEAVHPTLPEHVVVEVGGLGADDIIGRFDNLHYHGFIEDAESFLATAACIAIPSIQGGGIQIKVLDAIASGRPVITTQVGVRGVKRLPSSVSVTRTAEEFSQALQAAMSNAPRFYQEGVDWARERRIAFRAELQQAIHELS